MRQFLQVSLVLVACLLSGGLVSADGFCEDISNPHKNLGGMFPQNLQDAIIRGKVASPMVEVAFMYGEGVPQEGLRAFLEEEIARANEVLRASEVWTELRIAGLGALPLPPGQWSDLGTILEMSEVEHFRTAVSGDLVVVIVPDIPSLCGKATGFLGVPEFAHTVVQYSCFLNPERYVFLHEIAHLLGGHHDPQNTGGGTVTGVPDVGRGYIHGMGQTVMAITSGISTIPYISNPNVGLDGQPLGRADQNNSLVMNLAAHVAATYKSSGCTQNAWTLCLGEEGRFEVKIVWDGGSNTGLGYTKLFDSRDTGLFWFFDVNNVEVIVKVLDGCAINGHFWVSGAGMTNLGYTLSVRDTLRGSMRDYTNPVGQLPAAIFDTEAFACL